MTDDGTGLRDQQWELDAVVQAVVVGRMHLDTQTWDSDSEIVGAYCSSRISQ